MFQAAHYEAVASALAVQIGHTINSDFKIGCMVAMGPVYPATPNPNDVFKAERMMQTNYYLADVQVKGHYPAFLEHYFARRQFNLDITLEDYTAQIGAGKLIRLAFVMHLTGSVIAMMYRYSSWKMVWARLIKLKKTAVSMMTIALTIYASILNR